MTDGHDFDGNDFERPAYPPPERASEPPPPARYPPPAPRTPGPAGPADYPPPPRPTQDPSHPVEGPSPYPAPEPPQQWQSPDQGPSAYPPPEPPQQMPPEYPQEYGATGGAPPPPSSFDPMGRPPGSLPGSASGGGINKVALAIGGAVLAAAVAFFAIGAIRDDDTATDATADADTATDGDSETAESENTDSGNTDSDNTDSDNTAADASTDGAAASGTEASDTQRLSAGDNFDCVAETVEERLLPPDVNSLNELYTAAVSDEASLAYLEADFTCHTNPLGSDSFTEALRANLELGSGSVMQIDTGEARCVTQHLVDNSSDPYRVLAIGTDPADIDSMRAAMETCFDAEDVAYLNRESGSGPQAYGDDERLDGLFDECTTGDERACDLLWIGASEDSEYSELAFDCASRGATASGLCTPDISLGADGYADTTSPGVSTLSNECTDGDATACDLLAAVSPPGSKSEALGYSCGGRISGTALPDCRTEMADG